MVSEGKEQAIEHLSKAELAFLAVLLDCHGGLLDDNQVYRLTFENVQGLRGEVNRTEFEYKQAAKGLQFKIDDQTSEAIQRADDEVKEPREGKTYLAILNDSERIHILVEIDPRDINEIIQSARDKQTAGV